MIFHLLKRKKKQEPGVLVINVPYKRINVGGKTYLVKRVIGVEDGELVFEDVYGNIRRVRL